MDIGFESCHLIFNNFNAFKISPLKICVVQHEKDVFPLTTFAAWQME